VPFDGVIEGGEGVSRLHTGERIHKQQLAAIVPIEGAEVRVVKRQVKLGAEQLAWPFELVIG
jgi:hypothetical protein